MTDKAAFAVLFLLLCLYAAAASALDLSISYQTPIRCGKETVFTVTPSDWTGDTANCDFRIDDLRLYYTKVDPLTGAKSTTSQMVLRCDASKYPYNYSAEPCSSREFRFTFCASGYYQITFRVMDMNTMPRETKRKIIYITINDPDYPSVDEIADSIAAEYRAKYSDPWELALALNDWLVGNTVYDNDLLYCHPEGVLARKKGVCNAYQEAYAMLLDRVGIENVKVESRVNGGGHTWNLAKLNGHWVHIDPTWNDSTDTHFYFGVTDEMMNLTQGHAGLSAANGEISTCPDENYYLRTGKVTQWSDRYRDAIQKELNAGAESFTLDAGTILNSTYEDSIRKILCAARLSSEDWFSTAGTAILSLRYSAPTNCFTGSVRYTDHRTLVLPDCLASIGACALAGIAANAVRIPDTLTDEESLAALPTGIIWFCGKNSAAAAYAKENGISFKSE